MGKPFYPVSGIDSMTDDEIAEAEAFLRDRVTMLVCDAEGQAPTLDWLLERFAACVLRNGVTDALIDPWNEVWQLRGDMSETDFIGHCLQRLKAFAFRHGCNVWIVAHPAKPVPTRPNEKAPAPGPYSINGSSHWANKTDLGLTIHSPDPGLAQLHLWKSRMRRWGGRSAVPAIMEYDELTGVYRTYYKPKSDDPVGDMQPGLWTS
jgi:twinkle protein